MTEEMCAPSAQNGMDVLSMQLSMLLGGAVRRAPSPPPSPQPSTLLL
jgi:hypothetical protein